LVSSAAHREAVDHRSIVGSYRAIEAAAGALKLLAHGHGTVKRFVGSGAACQQHSQA
jgi:hypothetical protein